MDSNFEAARDEIAAAAARDMEWFAPSDRKQFLGEVALTAFATLLLNAFLSGFKSAAEEKAKEAGKKVFGFLWDAITDLFSGTGKGDAQSRLEASAAKAGPVAKALTEKEIDRIAGEVEKQLLESFAPRLPRKQAERLARQVREASVKHVLKAQGKAK